MTVEWIKCDDGKKWCPFMTVNLSAEHFVGLEGVYVIWHGGQNPATVYVGQGQIADRIKDHRNNARITAYSTLGLYVTWARVGILQRDGVERFLIDRLRPKETHAGPNAIPETVNLPWG